MKDKMNLSKIEEEYNDISSKKAWPLLYQKIGRDSLWSTCNEAKKPENKHLNRYRDVIPYDCSRIILKRCKQDYINANLVMMEEANRKYILTQGPLELTIGHFWLMVWEQNSQAILMLNKVIEKSEKKCYWYWPRAVGESAKLVLDDVKLQIEQISEQNLDFYTIRMFRITDLETEKTREVIQFHYTTWPDFGVPTSPTAFLEFLKKVRESGALEPDVGPAVVHCSAGIGRSGTFCLIDSCLLIIEKFGFERVDIPTALKRLRADRMGLIQTPDQLRFSYEAIIAGAKRLQPDWKEEEEEVVEESARSSPESSDSSEECPPPPPPRGESLLQTPVRPLPAPPADTRSIGTKRKQFMRHSSSWESYEVECKESPIYTTTLSDGNETSPAAIGHVSDLPASPVFKNPPSDKSASSSPPRAESAESEPEAKRRGARAARLLCHPLSISFAVLLVSVLFYKYVRN